MAAFPEQDLRMRLLEIAAADLGLGICAAIASTGTRLRCASNRPLMRCRLPGPQLPAQPARAPVICASAAAAKAATSSWRTCIQRMRVLRNASVKPLSESPTMPQTRSTPAASRVCAS
jgi:hypothetical protein